MREGDGFAVLVIDACLIVFSGSYSKCVDFVKNNKQLAYLEGLAIVARDTAEKVLEDSADDLIELAPAGAFKRSELPIPL